MRTKIDLADAVLCIGCDCLYPAREGTDCPSCGSRIGLVLARVIEPLAKREHAVVEPLPEDAEGYFT